jgi:hypothetical protein
VATKEQQLLWKAAVEAIGKRLNRELQPEEQVPDRLRELLVQIEANGKPKSAE